MIFKKVADVISLLGGLEKVNQHVDLFIFVLKETTRILHFCSSPKRQIWYAMRWKAGFSFFDSVSPSEIEHTCLQERMEEKTQGICI